MRCFAALSDEHEDGENDTFSHVGVFYYLIFESELFPLLDTPPFGRGLDRQVNVIQAITNIVRQGGGGVVD